MSNHQNIWSISSNLTYQGFQPTMVDYIRFVATTLRFESPMRWSTFGTDITTFDAVSLPEKENFLISALRRSDISDLQLGQYIQSVRCELLDEGTLQCDVSFSDGASTFVTTLEVGDL